MRLIDADALLAKEWDAENGLGWEKVISARSVLNAPTISASVEVVRRKDCVYWSDNLYCADFYTMEPEGFCSWAKKRIQ